MSAPAHTRDGAVYSPPDTRPPGPAPAEPPNEPTEVRLVGVDAQVVSPAWELELLVTGIVLVGLFQVPPWLDAAWRHWEPHLTLVGAVLGRAVLQATIAALYALIICFVVALALRGYWVALVGANSVFPAGVRWDKQREYGPIQAEISRERVRPLPTFIGRANDAASLVFATGFMLAAGAVSSIGFVAAIVGVFAVLAFILPMKVAFFVWTAIFAVCMLALVGAGATDMRRGAKLQPGSRSYRAVRGTLRVISGLTPAGVRSLGAVLTSNVNKRVAYLVMAVGLGGSYAMAFGTLAAGDTLPRGSNYAYFSEDQRASVVTADLYESLRGTDAASTRLPTIQSDVVTDPYVRLFVPYRVMSHDVALRRACPTLRPPAADLAGASTSAADDSVLACAARLHAVTLDGRPVAGGRFRFFTNPRTERRGFLMLIPAANLTAGEHLITLQPARRDPGPADTAAIRIPFWR